MRMDLGNMATFDTRPFQWATNVNMPLTAIFGWEQAEE